MTLGIDDVFVLPTAAVRLYDDPNLSDGDEGWSLDEMRESVRREGIREPIHVGISRADLEARGDRTPCSFNGNHRMAVALEEGIAEIRCVTSDADDAVPLEEEDIVALGGRVERRAPDPAAP